MAEKGCYLLDTHIFLWSLFAPESLSKLVIQTMADPHSRIFVSAITFWEISLKYAIGKLRLENYLPHELPNKAQDMRFETLPLTVDVASSFHILPRGEHKDPFDRMLVWQAIKSRYVLISSDPAVMDYAKYGLNIFKD